MNDPVSSPSRRQFLLAAGASLVAMGRAPSNLRGTIAADRHRPRYHIVPPANFLNDPNGPLFWKGKYHMFYQYAPGGDMFNTKHWYHVVSDDMVHWKNLGVAISPTPGAADKDGCWTGSAVVHNGVPTIIYTGAWFAGENERADRAQGLVPERQMVAVAANPNDSNLIKWIKVPQNPVLAAPPPELKIGDWRDPALWKEKDAWYMIIGGGGRGPTDRGVLPLYRSADLLKWDYLHPLAAASTNSTEALATASPSSVGTARMWECPDFFWLSDKPVLLVNVRNSYMTGIYRNHKFEPDFEGQIDYGSAVSAAKTMADGRGRRVWWGWIHEVRSVKATREAGWSGALTLPRVLTLRSDSHLSIEPVSELRSLRGRSQNVQATVIKPEDATLLREVSGDCLEIIAEIELGSARQAGLRVRSTPDGSEQTLIGYDRGNSMLFSDSTKSSNDPEAGGENILRGLGVQKGTLSLSPPEPLRLNVFVDASVIETFANNRTCITDRTYPSNNDSLGIGLFARGGEARLRSMQVWELKPISSDRLTSEWIDSKS
jgi:beta-fructofuranosidase